MRFSRTASREKYPLRVKCRHSRCKRKWPLSARSGHRKRYRKRPPNRGGPPYSNSFQQELLGCGFDRVPAECCVRLDDLQQCLVFRAVVPAFQLINAVPSLNNDALWRRALNIGNRLCSSPSCSSYGNQSTARRFLSLRRKFFSIGFWVCHIDFTHRYTAGALTCAFSPLTAAAPSTLPATIPSATPKYCFMCRSPIFTREMLRGISASA